MDDQDLPEPLRQHMAEWARRSDFEVTDDFVRTFFEDATDMDEARRDLERIAATNTKAIKRAIPAIRAVLADPPPEGTLADLVIWGANWSLDDPSDAGAKMFLTEVVEMLEEVLAAAPSGPPWPPHRPGGDDRH